MTEKEKDKKRKISKESFKKSLRIFKYIKPNMGVFTIGMLLLGLSTVAGLLFPRLLSQLMGIGIDNEMTHTPIDVFGKSFDFSQINIVIGAMVILFAIQGIVSFFRIYTFSYVTEDMMKNLRVDLFKNVVRMPMHFFNTRRVGELNSRMSSDLTTIQSTFTTILAEFLRQILTVVISIVYLIYLSKTLTLYMLLSLPIVIIGAVFFGRYVKKLGKQTQEEIAKSSTILEETLTGVQAVKSFVNEWFEVNRFEKRTEVIKRVAMKTAIWRGLFSTFIVVFMFGIIAFIIYQAVILVQLGEMSRLDFTTFLMFTVMLGASFGGLANQYSALQRGIGSIEEVLDLLDEQAENIPLEKTISQLVLKGDISFNDVDFTYSSRDGVQVLKNISFDVKSGQQVAIVGPSGAGKSTLVTLLLNFYQPTSGTVNYDGKPSSDYKLADLRNQMAIVPQEIILFGGTIKDNIQYGNTNASDEEIIAAATQANALEFINKFPEGMETFVGERGVQLSGGQKQRIAIARAVLKNPSILILDEATSSLDSESEKLVQDALDKLMKNRTTFVIAHRLSTIKNADTILVIENGQIREQGNHQELMAIEDGLFKKLLTMQFDIQ